MEYNLIGGAGADFVDLKHPKGSGENQKKDMCYIDYPVQTEFTKNGMKAAEKIPNMGKLKKGS